MAKVTIRKNELDQVVAIAKRAAMRTNSVVVVAEDRLDLADDRESSIEKLREDHPAAHFN
jgi:hypothetical protein